MIGILIIMVNEKSINIVNIMLLTSMLLLIPFGADIQRKEISEPSRENSSGRDLIKFKY